MGKFLFTAIGDPVRRAWQAKCHIKGHDKCTRRRNFNPDVSGAEDACLRYLKYWCLTGCRVDVGDRFAHMDKKLKVEVGSANDDDLDALVCSA